MILRTLNMAKEAMALQECGSDEPKVRLRTGGRWSGAAIENRPGPISVVAHPGTLTSACGMCFFGRMLPRTAFFALDASMALPIEMTLTAVCH